LRRSNNDIIIGCYSSQQTWQLNCDGRQWKGLVGTCPELCRTLVANFQLISCASSHLYVKDDHNLLIYYKSRTRGAQKRE